MHNIFGINFDITKTRAAEARKKILQHQKNRNQIKKTHQAIYVEYAYHDWIKMQAPYRISYTKMLIKEISN